MSETKLTGTELQRMADALPADFSWGDELYPHQLSEILSAMGYFDLLEVARESLAVIPVIKPKENGNGTIVRLQDAINKAMGVQS